MSISHTETLGVLFLTVAVISTVASAFAMYCIWRYGKWTTSTQLLLLLHFTLLFEEVTTLPYAYAGNDGLCKAFGFFHVYSGLSNIMVTGVLTLHYCNFILFTNHALGNFLSKYKLTLIFGFPLITLLPFSTDSYGKANDCWCTLPSSNQISNIWAIAVFYGWAWIVLFISFGLICYVIHKARMLDSALSRKVFSAIGIYVFFTMICWFPRTVPRLMKLFVTLETTNIEYFWTTFPLYYTGLIYTIILFWDRAVLKAEDNTSTLSLENGAGGEIHFTWDTFDDAVMDDRLTATSVALNPMNGKDDDHA